MSTQNCRIARKRQTEQESWSGAMLKRTYESPALHLDSLGITHRASMYAPNCAIDSERTKRLTRGKSTKIGWPTTVSKSFSRNRLGKCSGLLPVLLGRRLT